jgi:hypothetical protein
VVCATIRHSIYATALLDSAIVSFEVRGIKGPEVVVLKRGQVAVHPGRAVSATFRLTADCLGGRFAQHRPDLREPHLCSDTCTNDAGRRGHRRIAG